MKYKIVKPWLDIETQELHDTIGEIVEMDDLERAERLIRAGAFEEVKEEKPKKEEKPEKEEKSDEEEKPEVTSSRRRK